MLGVVITARPPYVDVGLWNGLPLGAPRRTARAAARPPLTTQAAPGEGPGAGGRA